MNTKERKRLADFMLGRQHASNEEAISSMEEAIATMRDPMGDMEAVERAIGDAILHLGEARGFGNAASDVRDCEDV
jgi:hypothetical protein